MSSPSVSFLMAVHCHQPVGNFGFVFEEAVRKAYEPFLTVLERHPTIRMSFHYSGSLLDWLMEHHPRFLHRLKRLVSQGQVELLASGYYEPILPLIPEDDRQGQIALMRQAIRRTFGSTVSGLWLTERVWEPELPKTLARAGMRYTMLDTNQFQGAREVLPNHLQVQDEQGWDLLGCYVTEYAGSSVVLFPASKRLRYWMPFQAVSRTVEFLKRLVRQDPVAITFADDGEKFGLWPKTYDWVYGQGWLEQLFSALEREASWLTTATFSDYLATVGPSGRVSLPCGSYDEMLEWSGGYFRNFFAKYPEANAMHQKMLSVSQTVGELKVKHKKPRASSLEPRAKRREELLRQAERELYMAQCNCAYWHGVFGGLYLAHLRRAVYSHLITAQRLLQQATSRLPALERCDLDGDGRAELVLRSPALGVVVDPDEDGAVTELDSYGKAVNLMDTLARRYEPYHENLKAKQATAVGSGGRPASIHDLLSVKEEGLETFLAYDDHRRSSFLDYALSAMPNLQDVVRSTWGEHRLWSGGPWALEPGPASRSRADRTAITLRRHIQDGRLQKTVTLWRNRPRLSFRYQVVDVTVPVVGLEWNVSLCDERWREASWHETMKEFQVRDPSLGLAVTMTIDPPATLAIFPIETVSESEEGLERTFQGLAIVCLWQTRESRRWTSQLEWTIEEP